jgi:hypothetical protein
MVSMYSHEEEWCDDYGAAVIWQWDSDDYGPDHKMMWLDDDQAAVYVTKRPWWMQQCDDSHTNLLYRLVSNLIYQNIFIQIIKKNIVWAFGIAAEHDHEHSIDGNHHILPKYNMQFFPLNGGGGGPPHENPMFV